MTMHLPPDLEARIRARVANGSFNDESDVIREALIALDERDKERLIELREDQGGIRAAPEDTRSLRR